MKYICHTYTRDNKYGAALSSVKMGKLHCKLIAQVHFHGDFFCTGIQTHYLPPCFLLPGHYLPCRDLHLTTLPLDHATSIFRQPLSFLSGVLQNLEFLMHVMTLPGPFKVRCFWVFKWYVPGIFSWRVFSVSTRNETDRDPFVLKLFGSGCDEFCPLEEFGRLTQHLRPQNWTAECHTGMAIDDPTILIITEFSIAVASFLLLVLVIAVVVSCCVRRDRKDSSGKYQSVNQDYR